MTLARTRLRLASSAVTTVALVASTGLPSACKSANKDALGTESLVRDTTDIPDSPGDAESDEIELDTELGEKLWPGEVESTQAIADSIHARIQRDYPEGNRPARRDAHAKAHGCVLADFIVDENVPAALQHGVFKPRATPYKAWIRFSNGEADPRRPDGKGDGRGMAIKLTGVEGDKILSSERTATTQDFVMINHPVFFIDDPQQYLRLMEKFNSTNPLVAMSAPTALGLKGGAIAASIASKRIRNPLYARYWSMVPYRLGKDGEKQAIKFSATPCDKKKLQDNDIPLLKKADDRDDYLSIVMQETLAKDEGACFEFLVQPRTAPSMSVEDSMREWKESEAPFYKVATIKIPKQVFNSPAQTEFCENLSYTPWHALPEHKPLGGVNRVRRVVYEQISKLRHGMNGAPRAEPTGNETF